jgi:hypothetical protein
LVLVGVAWWWAGQAEVRSSYPDVSRPQVLWSALPTTNGSVTADSGPVVGLAFRVYPDSFDARADRVYAALDRRIVAFDARVGSADWWRTVDRATGPVTIDYGDGIVSPDFETYVGTGPATFRVYNDTEAGDPLIEDLSLGSRVVGIAAYASNSSGGLGSPDLILAATEDGMLVGIWAENHTEAWRTSFPTPIGLAFQTRTMSGYSMNSAAFTQDGTRAFLRAGNGAVYGIETATGAILFTYGSLRASSDPIAFGSDQGERFLVGLSDGSLAVFDADGDLVGVAAVATSGITRVAAEFDFAIVGAQDGRVARVNLPNGGSAPSVSWTAQLAGSLAGPPEVVPQQGTVFLADTTGRVTALRLDGGGLEYRFLVCESLSAGPLAWVPRQSLNYFVGVGCTDGSVFALDARAAPRPVP